MWGFWKNPMPRFEVAVLCIMTILGGYAVKVSSNKYTDSRADVLSEQLAKQLDAASVQIETTTAHMQRVESLLEKVIGLLERQPQPALNMGGKGGEAVVIVVPNSQLRELLEQQIRLSWEDHVDGLRPASNPDSSSDGRGERPLSTVHQSAN